MNSSKRLLIVALILFGNLASAVNHYELIGVARSASADTIRKQCLGALALKKEQAKNEKLHREAVEKLGQVKIAKDRVALKKEVDRLEKELNNTKYKLKNFSTHLEGSSSGTIEVVCKTLQTPELKASYNKKLAEEEEKAREKKEEPSPKEGILAAIKNVIKETAKDTDVLLSKILGDVLGKIQIPDAAFKVFNNKLAIRNMKIIKAPSGPNVRAGLGFTGTMKFNQFAVNAIVYAVENESKKMEYSISLELPEKYKISDMFPAFKKLDTLSLPQGKLVVSTFEYSDPAGYSVEAGLNFIASLDLTGPLSVLNKIKDQAKKLKSVVVRSEPIFFKGLIPKDIKNAKFEAKIPMYIGVDFTKIPKMPKSITSIFKEITTDDFEFALKAPQLVFTIEGGVRLVLATQPKAIRLSMFGRIEPTSVSLGMRMREMLELKWFALGEAGIQLDFDEALLPVAAAFGIPFTGIGLNGQVELGKKGDARAILNLAGGARISGTKLPDIVFDAEAKNISFAHMINFASKIAVKTKIAKREIPVGKLPTIKIDRLRGYLSLKDTTIAQKEYPAGFAVEVDTQIFKKKAGFSIDFKHTAGTVGGEGYISNFDVNIKGKKLFTLTGPQFYTKSGQPVEGPRIAFDFNLKEPKENKFLVDGIFEVPAIDLKQKTHFLWSGWSLDADFETNYAGFTVLFGATINMKSDKTTDLPDPDDNSKSPQKPSSRLQKMRLKFGFKDDFAKFLSEQAKPAVDNLKKNASEKLERLNAKIGELSQQLEKLTQEGEKTVEKEIQRVQAEVKTLESQIAELEYQKKKKLTKEQAKKVQGMLTNRKSQLIEKKAYLKGFLQAAKKVAKLISPEEKQRLEAEIKTLEAKIPPLEKKLKAAKIGKKKPFRQQLADILKQLRQKKAHLKTAKVGKAVVTTGLKAAAAVTKKLADAKLLKKTVEKTLGTFSTILGALAKGAKIFQIKEALGEFNADEAAEGKLPKLVSFVAEINIPKLPTVTMSLKNVQFDLKKPIASVRELAIALIKGLKVSE